MPPKQKTPAPIDRPLSKAYVRQFTGWMTAEPPGLADPASFRIMENILINRDGSAGIRPGLRYLSYEQSPFTTPEGSVVLDYSFVAIGWGGSDDIAHAFADLEEGDLVVAAIRHADTTVFDSRMAIVVDLGVIGGILGPYYGKVWAGTIGADTSPITFPHSGCLIRLRNPDGNALEVDPLRITTAGPAGGNYGYIPALPGGGSGAVSCILTGGGIGGAYGTTHWDLPFSYWDATTDGAYGLTYISHTTEEFVPETFSPQRDSGDGWFGCTIGIKYGTVGA